MMAEGQKKHLSAVTFQGVVYNIYLMCQMQGPQVYILVLCKGDWQAASPETLATCLLDDSSGQYSNQEKWPDPFNYVTWACGILQAEWAKVQGGTAPPPPVTWTDRLEAYLFRVAFFRNADGTHTIKVV
jgi:hypothetical protein